MQTVWKLSLWNLPFLPRAAGSFQRTKWAEQRQNYFGDTKYFYILVRELSFTGLSNRSLSLLTTDTLPSKPFNPPTSGIHLRNWKWTKSAKSPTSPLAQPSKFQIPLSYPLGDVSPWVQASVFCKRFLSDVYICYSQRYTNISGQIITNRREVCTCSLEIKLIGHFANVGEHLRKAMLWT